MILPPLMGRAGPVVMPAHGQHLPCARYCCYPCTPLPFHPQDPAAGILWVLWCHQPLVPTGVDRCLRHVTLSLHELPHWCFPHPPCPGPGRPLWCVVPCSLLTFLCFGPHVAPRWPRLMCLLRFCLHRSDLGSSQGCDPRGEPLGSCALFLGPSAGKPSFQAVRPFLLSPSWLCSQGWGS